MQATFSGACCACLVSHPWQLVPYAALGLGRDGESSLASPRLEFWTLNACGENAIFSFRQHKSARTNKVAI